MSLLVTFPRALCIALLALWLSGYPVQASNLVYNGDFEIGRENELPPGWAMWGSDRWKIPANFTRDTTSPHSGNACFRIHHPANTAGYVVSDPKHALSTRPGMMYRISFWARASVAGWAWFTFDAYEQLAPDVVEAPSPGRWPLRVTTEWQRYDFTIRDGWDFRAKHSRYLLLTFIPTRNRETECTLWVDEVVAEEAPVDRASQLLEPETLTHRPLDHRLEPGSSLDLTIDAGNALRTVAKEVAGISFHRLSGFGRHPYAQTGDYILAPELEQAIRDLHLPMTRLYGVGDEPYPVEEAIDKAAQLCDRTGIPQESSVLELEEQGANRSLPPEVWAKAVNHSVAKGYGFQHWEISNEPYVMQSQCAFPTPDDYIAHVVGVSAAIREVQPSAQIGIGIDPSSQSWGNYVLKQCAGSYDFVVGHYYAAVPHPERATFEDAVLTQNLKEFDLILMIDALMRGYNPGRPVYQYDTEWGLASTGPKGEPTDETDRNANIMGTVHRAVRMIYYAREGLMRGASTWEFFCRLERQGFGILSRDAPDKRFMVYWLYYYFSRHLGDWVVDMQGMAPYYAAPGDGSDRSDRDASCPLTPALVTLSNDKTTLYIIVANGSWKSDVPCTVHLRGFEATRGSGTALSSDNLDAKPLLENKSDFVRKLPVTVTKEELRCIIPAHSVVFVALQGKG